MELFERKLLRLIPSIGVSSNSILPELGLYIRLMRFIMVDLPEPVLPTIAIDSPLFISNEIFLSAFTSLSGYSKLMFLKDILPWTSWALPSFELILAFVFKNSLILFCEAAALCIIEVTHPIEAIGQVSIFRKRLLCKSR